MAPAIVIDKTPNPPVSILKNNKVQICDNGKKRLTLTQREIDILKKSWFDELIPEFPEDIVGKQFFNVMEAMESPIFWELVDELEITESGDNKSHSDHDEENHHDHGKYFFNHNVSFVYHQSSCFTKTIKIVMMTLENLSNLDQYFEQMGLMHLRLFNSNPELFESLKYTTIELLKLSFADAFDITMQFIWSKLIDIIIAKMTQCEDLKLADAVQVYANANAMMPTTVFKHNETNGELESVVDLTIPYQQPQQQQSVNLLNKKRNKNNYTTAPSSPVSKSSSSPSPPSQSSFSSGLKNSRSISAHHREEFVSSRKQQQQQQAQLSQQTQAQVQGQGHTLNQLNSPRYSSANSLYDNHPPQSTYQRNEKPYIATNTVFKKSLARFKRTFVSKSAY